VTNVFWCLQCAEFALGQTPEGPVPITRPQAPVQQIEPADILDHFPKLAAAVQREHLLSVEADRAPRLPESEIEDA